MKKKEIKYETLYVPRESTSEVDESVFRKSAYHSKYR